MAQNKRIVQQKMLKINDIVHWRDSWGSAEIEKVKVTSIDITKEPNEKYGDDALEASWDLIKENRVIVGLEKESGGMAKWAYSYQIAPTGHDPRDFHVSPLYEKGWY
jgi:hypothetical protein